MDGAPFPEAVGIPGPVLGERMERVEAGYDAREQRATATPSTVPLPPAFGVHDGGPVHSLAMAAPLCRAAALRPTPYPSATGDRASEAILRPTDSPKCPWDVRKRPPSPVAGAAAS